jgi:hypothetical protein
LKLDFDLVDMAFHKNKGKKLETFTRPFDHIGRSGGEK